MITLPANLNIFAPIPKNTASYFSCKSFKFKFFPSSKLVFVSIPKDKILFITLSNIFLSNLKSGIPYLKIPPSLSLFSKIVTLAPLLAKNAAHVSPRWSTSYNCNFFPYTVFI